MKQLYMFLLLILCIIYFSACTSESYRTDTVKSSDTSSTAKIDTLGREKAPSIKGKTFTVKSPPNFVLSLAGNFDIGVSETSLNADPNQFISGQNFGVKNGFGFVATGKIPLEKKTGNLRLIINASYNRFHSDEQGTYKYNVISGGVGLENSFTPRFSVKPFIGAAIMGSMISGSASYNINGTQTDLTIKNSFRLGYSIYAGLEYGLTNNIGINMGARFMNANTWLKSSKDDQNGNEIGLRDAFISPPIAYSGWKNFAFTTFFIGTSIYFGVRDRLYKF